MKMPLTTKTSLLFFVLLFVEGTAIAQEVRIRPNIASSQHVMIEPLNTNFGVFLGEAAGRLNVGASNTFVGFSSGNVNTTGANNTFVGRSAGAANSVGQQNTFLGAAAGQVNQTADFNTIVGSFAGSANTTGSSNTFVGQAAGNITTTGSNNTFLGRNAGAGNTTGSGNVYIGNDAGKNETRNNRLYIHNTDAGSGSALIYGDFSSKFLLFNGSVGVNKAFTGTSLNVRSSETDFLVLSTEDETGDEVFYVEEAGTVFVRDSLGIGTASPEGHTHIKSTGDVQMILEADADNANESDNPQVEFRQDGGSTKVFLGYDESKLGENVFGISTHSRDGIFRVNPNGEVGINNNNNDVSLTVQSQSGDIYLLKGEDENGSNKFTVKPNGLTYISDRLGVGEAAPDADVHIRNVNNPRILIQSDGTSEESGRVSLRQSNGSGADILYDGTNTDDVFAIETFSSGNSGGKKFIVDLSGNVGIGTNIDLASGYKLSVDGKVICEELRVDLEADWPDYVFLKDYELPTLTQVKSHIEEKGHLIGVPSADDIKIDGLHLGEMNKVLMEKVEELTLYILQQEERIQKLEQAIQK